MLLSQARHLITIFQLVLAFLTIILAAFAAAIFGAEFGYGVVWWSCGWTLVIACLRWYAHDFHRSVIEQAIHLAFELFALADWIVATAVLAVLDVHLNKLRRDYDYAIQHNIELSGDLITHQFSALGLGALYCTYALTGVAALIMVLFMLSTLQSIHLLRISRTSHVYHKNGHVYSEASMGEEQMEGKSSRLTI